MFTICSQIIYSMFSIYLPVSCIVTSSYKPLFSFFFSSLSLIQAAVRPAPSGREQRLYRKAERRSVVPLFLFSSENGKYSLFHNEKISPLPACAAGKRVLFCHCQISIEPSSLKRQRTPCGSGIRCRFHIRPRRRAQFPAILSSPGESRRASSAQRRARFRSPRCHQPTEARSHGREPHASASQT